MFISISPFSDKNDKVLHKHIKLQPHIIDISQTNKVKTKYNTMKDK